MGETSHQTAMQRLRQALLQHDALSVEQAIGDLINLRAPLGTRWQQLARVSIRNGALGQARSAMEIFVAQATSPAQAMFAQAAMLAEIGDVTAADRILATVPPTIPDRATYAHFAGTLSLTLGRLSMAAVQLREALASRPASGISWLSLVEAERHRPAGEWTADLLAADGATQGAPARERAAYLYARGSALHALARHDDAFASFAEGAAMMHMHIGYDLQADRNSAVRAKRLSAQTWPTIDSVRPIFVFGTPRSGTTLVEQIITTHPDVVGGGEVGIVERALANIRSPDKLATRYLDLAAERFGPTGRFVDKTLTMSRHAGVVAAILPAAPMILVCRRELDVGWSAFRTFFGQGLTWSWSLPDIAAHLRIERDLQRHWRDVLGDRLLVIKYEELVSDPRPVIDMLLRHCDLSPHPDVFAPHRTDRPVITSSASQVRHPIGRHAIGAADAYRHHLEPLIIGLAD